MLGALLVAALTTTAVAYADEQDDEFVALLTAQDIPAVPDELIGSGRAACENYGSCAL